MMWYTPPENQGQIVVVSYGWHEGRLYRQVYDRSDRTVTYAVANDRAARKYADSGDGPWNSAPQMPASAWRRCSEPEVIR